MPRKQSKIILSTTDILVSKYLGEAYPNPNDLVNELVPIAKAAYNVSFKSQRCTILEAIEEKGGGQQWIYIWGRHYHVGTESSPSVVGQPHTKSVNELVNRIRRRPCLPFKADEFCWGTALDLQDDITTRLNLLPRIGQFRNTSNQVFSAACAYIHSCALRQGKLDAIQEILEAFQNKSLSGWEIEKELPQVGKNHRIAMGILEVWLKKQMQKIEQSPAPIR